MLFFKQIRYATVTVAIYISTGEMITFDRDYNIMYEMFGHDEDVKLQQHYMLIAGSKVSIDELESSFDANMKGFNYKPGAKI